MAARVGEGNGGAPATKDGETKEEEEVRREANRWEETSLVKQYTVGQNGLLASVFERQRPVPKLAG